jgi:hypothetical protein
VLQAFRTPIPDVRKVVWLIPFVIEAEKWPSSVVAEPALGDAGVRIETEEVDSFSMQN